MARESVRYKAEIVDVHECVTESEQDRERTRPEKSDTGQLKTEKKNRQLQSVAATSRIKYQIVNHNLSGNRDKRLWRTAAM